MKHASVKLARAVDWRFLEETFGAVYTDKPGRPPLPTAGRAILKHTYDLSDEALCDRRVEKPYVQYFCDEEFFRHAVFDRSSLTRWLLWRIFHSDAPNTCVTLSTAPN
jgi:hypothetical protein